LWKWRRWMSRHGMSVHGFTLKSLFALYFCCDHDWGRTSVLRMRKSKSKEYKVSLEDDHLKAREKVLPAPNARRRKLFSAAIVSNKGCSELQHIV
jgi:hypothetical protein